MSNHPEHFPTFEAVRHQWIESLAMTFHEYRHRVTGALHYHLAADHPESVFLIALRTMPQDSTGVAHILEHTALCGSRRFPVRDPFFLMMRRSLNTFMNAFTSSDWTAYPFASQNEKDFNNLLSVYLDAVFFPRLDPLDFAQEGHRLEFSDPVNPNSELVFKGVVFNEMKGALSSPISRLHERLNAHVYPTTTYHYNSGGEPQDIPTLTYEALVSFHRRHYHPSNAIVMTFGRCSVRDVQKKLEEEAFQDFTASEDRFEVPNETRYSSPLEVTETYPSDQKEKQTHVVLSWLLGPSMDHEALLQARFLSAVLLDHSAAPLMEVLETSSLGTAPSPLCGLSDSEREMTFSCGVEGSEPQHAEAVQALILETLASITQKGIPVEQQRAVLHQMELHQREITGGSYPYGLQLIFSVMGSVIHRADPLPLLNIETVLAKLRQDIEAPNFIKHLIQNLLLKNPHRVRLTFVPDDTLHRQEADSERQRLLKLSQQLSAEDKQKIIQSTMALTERQKETPDVEVLPKVTLADIPTDILRVEKKNYSGLRPLAPKLPHDTPMFSALSPTSSQGKLESLFSEASVYLKGRESLLTFYPQGTNGLVYQDIVIDLPDFSSELLPYLPLYTQIVTELGCGDKDYLRMQNWQYQVTGGIGAHIGSRVHLDNLRSVKAHLTFGGKALVSHYEDLLTLLKTTMHSVRFDEHSRLKELIQQDCARFNQSVVGHGHRLAMLAASAGVSEIAHLSHNQEGLAALEWLNDWSEDLSLPHIRQLSTLLEKVHQEIMRASHQGLLIGEGSKEELFLKVYGAQQDPWTTPDENQTAFRLPLKTTERRQAWTLSTSVNFCAKAYPTVGMTHPDAPALGVLGIFLHNNYLHQVIREEGGAYGGGANHQPGLGAFRFYSYRDPRLMETLRDFDRAIEWVVSTPIQARHLEEAILMAIGDIDKPSSPAGEAKKAFYDEYYGRTFEIRQAYRSAILSVTGEALKRVAETYLKPEKASIAVITNEKQLSELTSLNVRHYRIKKSRA